MPRWQRSVDGAARPPYHAFILNRSTVRYPAVNKRRSGAFLEWKLAAQYRDHLSRRSPINPRDVQHLEAKRS